MMLPTAISVTGDEPEIAAKNMHAATDAMATPPGIQPSKALATSTRRRAIPPDVMIAPDAMNNGIARNSCLVSRDSMFCMIGNSAERCI